MTTLYITLQGAHLRVRHQQFQVFYRQGLQTSVPANQVKAVVVIGACSVTHGAVRLALQRGIPLLYLSHQGRYFGRLEGTKQARLDYLTRQVEQSRDEAFLRRQAQAVVVGKLHNSRKLLMRLQKRRRTAVSQQAVKEMADLIGQVKAAETVAAMLGYEGQGAKLYFRGYGSLLKGVFEFDKRTRRPPTDPVNSLLSLGYTLLLQNVHAAVEASGLHTHFGCLHVPQANRPSLVCDLVEEFRAQVVDSLVAYLLNSGVYGLDDFTAADERGGVYLQSKALKVFLRHWEDRLQLAVVHPHTGMKVSLRRCFELQVAEYVRVVMGERAVYRPMLWQR